MKTATRHPKYKLTLGPKSHLKVVENTASVDVTGLIKQISNDIDIIPESDDLQDLVLRLGSKHANTVWPATTELFFAAECIKRGFEIELHPSQATGKKPEFLAKKDNIEFLLEVRSLLPPLRDDVEGRVFANLQGQAKKILGASPVHVEISPQGHISGSFSVRKLAHAIAGSHKRFLENIGNEFAMNVDGVPFQLRFFILGGAGGPSIGWFKGAGSINEVRRIRNAIATKAHRYGKTGMPFVVAIDSQDWFRVSPEQLNWALFGNQVLHASIPKIGSAVPTKTWVTRTKDALFSTKKYTRVSAVVFHRAMWDRQQIKHVVAVYHNAYARHPLSEKVFKGLPQYVVREDKPGEGHYEWIDGKGDSF